MNRRHPKADAGAATAHSYPLQVEKPAINGFPAFSRYIGID